MRESSARSAVLAAAGRMAPSTDGLIWDREFRAQRSTTALRAMIEMSGVGR